MESNPETIRVYRQKNIQILESRLTSIQKKKVENIAKAFWELNNMELWLCSAELEKSLFTVKNGRLRRNLEAESVLDDNILTSKEYLKEKTALKEILKDGNVRAALGLQIGGGGGGVKGEETENDEGEQGKEVEEVVVQKEFDVVLVSFDAPKKLTVIKEVKSIFGLGLKESKDLVEGLPATLKEKANADESQAFKERLEALSCVIEIR